MESIRFRFKTKITMEPVTACDLLISYLEKSNLNLQLVETPFEAQIEIRKTFHIGNAAWVLKKSHF